MNPIIKKAFLCGINYINTSIQLNGCINDVENMKRVLMTEYGYKSADIVLLTDKTSMKPTKANILKYLQKLVNESSGINQIYFHYSGHGSNILDQNNDEIDGQDECIIPIDYLQTNQVIIDDEIHQIIKNVNENCKVIMVFDACHSGSMVDLKYNFECLSVNQKKKLQNENYLFENWTSEFKLSQIPSDSIYSHIITISGCQDDQVSADAYIDKKFQGALSYVLLKVLQMNQYRDIKLKYLLKDIHCLLKIGKYQQKPVIQCSQPIDMDEIINL